jgi:hypothetical protein
MRNVIMIPWATHVQQNSEYHMNKPAIDFCKPVLLISWIVACLAL